MMQTRWQENRLDSSGAESLPAAVSQDVYLLLWKAALCCPPEAVKQELVLVIRRRPVDRLGREGCRVEILCQGPTPAGGLEAIRSAGGIDLWANDPPLSIGRNCQFAAPTSRTLSLECPLMGGWRLILDARWSP